MNDKNTTNEEVEELEVDHGNIAIEMRRSILTPMAAPLQAVIDMLDEFGDTYFQKALGYNAVEPVTDEVKRELGEYVEAYRLRSRELMSLLRGAQTASMCPGEEGVQHHLPHVFFEPSQGMDDYLEHLADVDPDECEEAKSNVLEYDWPWLGVVMPPEKEVVFVESAPAMPVLDYPIITAEQTEEQIRALRDEKHRIRVAVPVPISRMDENNEFTSLEDFVEDAIGGETLIMTEVTMRPVGLHAGTHVLYEVTGVADFTHEINSFGENGINVEDPGDPNR